MGHVGPEIQRTMCTSQYQPWRVLRGVQLLTIGGGV